MVNIRVNLDDAGPSASPGGVRVDDVQAMDGIGRFSWVEDPEGNRIELWEPAPEALIRPT
jgi:predicted enzyme related to lactoylglutathione lyase